jgi:chorismate mutase/prephenate dehydratase
MKELAGIRAKIDGLDEKLLALLNERAELAKKIAEVKRKKGAPVYVQSREIEILKKVARKNAGPLSAEALAGVFREIFSATRSVEKELKVACLGPAGTFSHLAAQKLFGASSVYALAPGFDGVFRDVEKGSADFGVVPVENMIEGSIGQTMDLLIESQARIFGETYYDVHHNLLSRAKSIRSIKALYTHYMPLGQCRKWIAVNLPGVKVVETSSSSLACLKALDDPKGAAIGALEAASIYGLGVLVERIEERTGNQTRFFVISMDKPPVSGRDKTSIVFSIKDSPGALFKILSPFAERGINLSKIQSRPRKTPDWEYLFFVDFEGNLNDAEVKLALKKVKSHTQFFKALGSYPNARA